MVLGPGAHQVVEATQTTEIPGEESMFSVQWWVNIFQLGDAQEEYLERVASNVALKNRNGHGMAEESNVACGERSRL